MAARPVENGMANGNHRAARWTNAGWGAARWLTTLTAMALATGCASDAWRNNQATGYNGYLNDIAQACAPLQIGDKQLSEMIRLNAVNESYNYFVDATSRLYYSQLEPESYRTAITGFFGAGSTNEQSFQCIFSHLPAGRAASPARRVIMY
jgi:hypothetical protein